MCTTKLITYKNVATLLALASLALPAVSAADDHGHDGDRDHGHDHDHDVRPYDDEALVQVGPRPYYLIDKMQPRPAQAQARALRRRSILQDRLLDRSPRRRHVAVSGAHQGKPRGRCAHGRRHPGMRRDLHQGRPVGLPSRSVRSAHDHQHPGHAARGACAASRLRPPSSTRPARAPRRRRRCAARVT